MWKLLNCESKVTPWQQENQDVKDHQHVRPHHHLPE